VTKSNRKLLLCLFTATISGCGGFSGTQPPAPVFGGRATKPPESIPTPKTEDAIKPGDSDGSVITEPLKESTPTEPESIEFIPEIPPSETEPEEPILQEEQPTSPKKPAEKPKASEPEQEIEPSTLAPFEPMEISAPLSPAVNALVLAANQKSSSGNLEIASSTIERAIRIEPRNANLYYKLAVVRLKQSKPRLAEDLAKKSALLATNDRALKKHSWLLIAHARELQKNFKGAKEAKAKANRL
jgi:hypothetical protein